MAGKKAMGNTTMPTVVDSKAPTSAVNKPDPEPYTIIITVSLQALGLMEPRMVKG